MLHVAMGDGVAARLRQRRHFGERAAKFLRYVAGWFTLLAAATVAYGALWHPGLLGAWYHHVLGGRSVR